MKKTAVIGANQIFYKCPRCGSDWGPTTLTGFSVYCDTGDCLGATTFLGLCYEILFLRFDDYQLEWYKNSCLIVDRTNMKPSVKIPLLAFDVTESELELYLTFL